MALAQSLPYVVFHVNGEDVLTIDKGTCGLLVNANVRSPDGRLVAELRANRFAINANNYFKIHRPDKHSLTVRDQAGAVALDIRFLNERAVKVLGRLYGPGVYPITISEEYALIGTNRFHRSCAIGGRGVLFVEDPKQQR